MAHKGQITQSRAKAYLKRLADSAGAEGFGLGLQEVVTGHSSSVIMTCFIAGYGCAAGTSWDDVCHQMRDRLVIGMLTTDKQLPKA